MVTLPAWPRTALLRWYGGVHRGQHRLTSGTGSPWFLAMPWLPARWWGRRVGAAAPSRQVVLAMIRPLVRPEPIRQQHV